MGIVDSVHRKNTAAFVGENPQDLVVTRRRKVTTAAGGFVWEDTGDLMAQRGRIVRSSNRGAQVERTLPDGNLLIVTATLIAEPGFDLERGDLLTDSEGTEWSVGEVSRTPAWRVNAELGRHGS